jgi:hypothetical protein
MSRKQDNFQVHIPHCDKSSSISRLGRTGPTGTITFSLLLIQQQDASSQASYPARARETLAITAQKDRPTGLRKWCSTQSAGTLHWPQAPVLNMSTQSEETSDRRQKSGRKRIFSKKKGEQQDYH